MEQNKIKLKNLIQKSVFLELSKRVFLLAMLPNFNDEEVAALLSLFEKERNVVISVVAEGAKDKGKNAVIEGFLLASEGEVSLEEAAVRAVQEEAAGNSGEITYKQTNVTT